MATLVGQSMEQPSGRLQKVHVLQPDVFLHCWQQSAAVKTCFACCWELTSKTIGSPSTFCCSRIPPGQHQNLVACASLGRALQPSLHGLTISQCDKASCSLAAR